MCCILLMAKSWSANGASQQPAFMGNCLTISNICLPCPLVDELALVFYAPLRLGYVLSTFFLGGGWSGFSTVGVGAILGNECTIQDQNYIALLPRNEVIAGLHYKDWI